MTVWTILLSVFLHGMTAVPLVNWYANASADVTELKEVTDINIRRRRLIGRDSGSIG